VICWRGCGDMMDMRSVGGFGGEDAVIIAAKSILWGDECGKHRVLSALTA
jgi:hypothetical protein